MESAVLSLVYLLCTLLITVMLFRNLPLAWRLFSSPHWMVHLKNLKLILNFLVLLFLALSGALLHILILLYKMD